MGSSLPKHDAKEQKGQIEKRQKTHKKKKKKPQGQTASNTIKAKII